MMTDVGEPLSQMAAALLDHYAQGRVRVRRLLTELTRTAPR